MKKMSAVLVLMGLSLPVAAQDTSPVPRQEIAPSQIFVSATEPTDAMDIATASEAAALDADAQNQWAEASEVPGDVSQEPFAHDSLSHDVATAESAAAENTAAEISGEWASDGIAAGAQGAQVAATGTLTTAATVGFGIAAAAAIYSVAADSSDNSTSPNSGGTTGTR
ncbi:hypothetical protein [Stenotrophomonas sp. Iso1]|uniref:hypothetical protein n=1 Tax=Stenotrophomonas sp. Iso1 TaxID=2977283 RepID=UPI0022B7C296|nr:hypothetical protein [Stenotrophomonas sp. Iso1]